MFKRLMEGKSVKNQWDGGESRWGEVPGPLAAPTPEKVTGKDKPQATVQF